MGKEKQKFSELISDPVGVEQSESDKQEINVQSEVVATRLDKNSERRQKTVAMKVISKTPKNITDMMKNLEKNPSVKVLGTIEMQGVVKDETESDVYRPMGRPKVTEENRKNNKVMMSFTDVDYEEIQRYKKILNKATITSTLEEFIKIGMEVKRREILFELGAFSQDDTSESRGKGF